MNSFKSIISSLFGEKRNKQPALCSIKIGGKPVSDFNLKRNVLVAGSAGTGKSVAISQMIEDARACGKKMVIYDKSGEYTQKFFRPGIDVIVNPVEASCADWNISADLKNSVFGKSTPKFTVRDFVSREDDACLFLVSQQDHHEAIKPFVSAWIELALVKAMSMAPTSDIRLMFFLDELTYVALTESRKIGISIVVGIQNIGQMEEIYGDELARVLIANMQNRVIFRVEDERFAQYLEEMTFDEREGLPLLEKTELMIIPDLTSYVKLRGDHSFIKTEHQF